MKNIYYLFFILYFLVQSVFTHGIDEEEEGEEHVHEEGEAHVHEEGEEEHKEYAAYVTVIGIVVILACSFFGTVLPIVFKNRHFFKENTILFGSVKLFGTGIILSTAFIHMLTPADQLLTSKYTITFFNETYPCFAGAFAIIGIMITHVVQVITSHILCQHPVSQDIQCMTPGWNNLKSKNSHKTSDVSQGTLHEDISDKKVAIMINDLTTTTTTTNKVSDGLTKEGDGCCGEQHQQMMTMMMERQEKQVVCYLLEIGISLHSVLIGIAFGLTNDEELIALLVAMMFHQFFEGVALSSVFVEAHFRKMKALIIMVTIYTCTMPLGGLIGLLIRNSLSSTDKTYITLQGTIDAMAAGILIYDALVNILSRHCNSMNWRSFAVSKKMIQLVFFYVGLAAMAIIGLWA